MLHSRDAAWWGPSVRLVALALTFPGGACSLPDTSQRGFDSREVLHIRDPQLRLRDFSWDASAIYLARAVPGVSVAGQIDAPYDQSLLDLGAGPERPIATGVVMTRPLPASPGPGRSLAMLHFLSDAVIPATLSAGSLPPLQLTFLDEVTGERIEISNVIDDLFSLGATRADPILIDRADSTGAPPRPWAGAPEALIPLPASVQRMVGRDRLGFLGLTNASTATATTPGLSSITRYPFDGGAPLVAVPALLGSYTSVTAPGETAPTGVFAITTDDSNPILSCRPASPSDPAPPCLLFCDGTLTDRSRRGLMRDLDTGGTFELPGMLESPFADILRLAPDDRDALWSVGRADGAGMEVFSWHVGDPAAAGCLVPPPPGLLDPREIRMDATAWRPGSGQFAAIVQPPLQSLDPADAWILVVGTAGGECHAAASAPGVAYSLAYAPDGSRLAFLVSADGSSKVYLTDGDGAEAHVLPTGSHPSDLDFHDPQHLLLWNQNLDGPSVSWLSVDTMPVIEHPIADRVRQDLQSSWAWLTPRWVLLADADARADGSFSLDVVNIDTGERRLVSRGVVDFRTSWTTAPPAGASELLVVYLVQSRAPSAQDGVWTAHLPLSDFAP